MKTFNPDAARFVIPFEGDLRNARDASRQVFFGPVSSEQVFDVISVSDATTGDSLPTDLLTLEDAGCSGGEQRRVTVSFNGTRLTSALCEETGSDRGLFRLKAGLREVHRAVEKSGGLEKSTLADVVAIYNGANDALRGTYEPLFAAITQRRRLAIEVNFRDRTVQACEPSTAILLLDPRPTLASQHMD